MSRKTEQVKSGYVSLSLEEKQELMQFIKEYDSANLSTKQSMIERADKMSGRSVGPRNANACACCGR
jgi:hypothetical protein